MTRAAATAALLGFALAVAACTGRAPAAPQPTPSTSPAAPSATATATSSTATTPSSTATLASPSPAGDLPDGWTAAHTDDGSVTYGVPPDWERGSVIGMRDGVAADIESGQLGGELLEASKWFLGLLDSGAVRGLMTGPSPVEGYTVSVLYLVMGKPSDLRSGAEAVIRDAPHPPSQHLSGLAPVTLPMGEALIATITSDSTGGSPSRGVLYFTLLRDGSLLWIDGAAPLADAQFDGFMAQVAATVAEP